MSINQRTIDSTFRAIQREVARMNAAIDKAEAESRGEDFLSPEDEDYRTMASGLSELLDRFWHLKSGAAK